MDPNTFPTKANLINAKNSLALGVQGYELMDKKRNILIKEIMSLIDQAAEVQNEIDQTFRLAYKMLQQANIEMGIRNIEDISQTIPIEKSVFIKQRSVMGTEIPLVHYNKPDQAPVYPFLGTRVSLDDAYRQFNKVKELTIRLSMIENSAYRLANSIRKTQRRANALKNVTIPKYTELVAEIESALEEKEREEFTRLKVIKKKASN
jgi:V/A-type H+-transporting ATPase subunit D